MDKSGVRGALILGVWMKSHSPRTPWSAIHTRQVFADTHLPLSRLGLWPMDRLCLRFCSSQRLIAKKVELELGYILFCKNGADSPCSRISHYSLEQVVRPILYAFCYFSYTGLTRSVIAALHVKNWLSLTYCCDRGIVV